MTWYIEQLSNFFSESGIIETEQGKNIDLSLEECKLIFGHIKKIM